MPQLGLGLGLHKSSFLGSAYRDLIKASTWFIDPARPEGVLGTATAFNAKPANPIQDQAGKVGKNLFDPVTPATIPTNSFRLGNGYRSYSNSSFVNGIVVNLVLKPNTTYFYEYKFTLGGNARGNGTFFIVDGNLNFDTGTTSPKIRSFTTSNGGIVTFNFMRSGGGNDLLGWIDVFDIMLSEGVPVAYEPYGKANALMTNVAWTSADGYRVETINGKTNVFFNLDGSDTFGALNSASAPNPTGSDDFWQLEVFRPDEVNATRYFGLTRNGATGGFEVQYGALHEISNLRYFINGDPITIETASINLKYLLFGRLNGRRFAVVNGIEKHEGLYDNAIVQRSNTQLGCRSNSADGTVKGIFSDGLQGICAMGVGPQGSIDKAKLVATVAKAMNQIYGLGV